MGGQLRLYARSHGYLLTHRLTYCLACFSAESCFRRMQWIAVDEDLLRIYSTLALGSVPDYRRDLWSLWFNA